MASYLKRKNKKIKNQIHSKFEGIIFCINFFVKKIFKEQDFSKFTGGLDKVEYGIYLIYFISNK